MTVKQTQPSLKQQGAMYVMIGKQLASSYPGWAILIGFLLGAAFGLIVLGWGLWPVQWTDAKPSSLSSQYQQAFLNDSANSFAVGMPINEVSAQLGEGWSDQSGVTDLQVVTDILNGMVQVNYAGNVNNLIAFRDALQAYGSVGPAGAPTNVPGISDTMKILLTILILILLIILAFWIFRRLRSEKPKAAAVAVAPAPIAPGAAVVVPAANLAAGGARDVQKTAWEGEMRPPLAQFVSVYQIGDDRYDMSKSIDASNGDFLGECGVGISETIGSGTPDKVTALEIWLFDKTDVRTVTKVLMSDHAFNDPTLKARLAPKGDPMLARLGQVVDLHTKALTIRARIVDLAYGSGGGLPANSFFQQVKLEVASWSEAS